MNTNILPAVVIVGLGLVAYFSVLFIVARFGTWSRWEKAYRAEWPRRCKPVYEVVWEYEPCIYVAPTAKGLHLKIARWGFNAPLFIPWSDIAATRQRVPLGSAVYLTFARAQGWGLSIRQPDAGEILSYRPAARP